MKVIPLAAILLMAGLPEQAANDFFKKVNWIHGSANCAENTDPAIQVVRYNATTWILRQNKCVHYEAPFMFLFLGEKKALLFDTGATADESKFPLYATISRIIMDWETEKHISLEVVVAHTHNHGDHRAADKQFEGKPKTSVIGLRSEDVTIFFHLKNWPDETATFDLGNRAIEIIPIPGHEPASIAAYDPQTKFLLTGDTFYPGRLYVREWGTFKNSIQRLTDFTASHDVSFVLGNHIEMTNVPGKDYPVGTTFQPDEHVLPLTPADLRELNDSLKITGTIPVLKIYNRYTVYPAR
jgi:hydroxyacylglutathione hydrolase